MSQHTLQIVALGALNMVAILLIALTGIAIERGDFRTWW